MAYHSWSKHATLINNCYPTAPDELNPKSNELSYLVFYANSKPAKLTKCGIHLEKRVASDVKKRKKQYVDIDVSLQIISKLLGACKKDLNLFSKNVVKIIADSLSTKDIELVARACSVRKGKHGVDSEFTTIYESLISDFANYATYEIESDVDLEKRYNFIGLHALQAAVTSDALYKAKSKHQFQQIIPALLKNLTDDEIGLEHLQKIEMEENNNNSDGHSKPNQFSINSTTISAEQNARLAYNCYKQVFKYANTSNINMSLNPTFAFLDDNNLWLPSSFGISLAFVVISSLQPVFRHTLVTKIIQELNSLINVAESLPKKFTLIEMLTSILTNKVNLVNYSIIEVLGCLLRHLLNSVKLRDQNLEVANLNSDEKASVAETSLIKKSAELEEMNAQRLFTCIGISISDSRKTLLKCLDTVLKKNNESKKLYPEYPRNEIQIETFQKTTGLCSDDDHEVRIAYAQITTYFKQPSIHFLNSLHLSLYQFLLSQKSTPQDYITLSTILRALFNRFHVDQVICGVPVVFKLQVSKEEKLENYTRQRALASIIVLYFYDIATGLKISELQDYIKKEISNKPNQLLQPVDIWLDHQIIVPLLCKHKELTDIGGKQLEENLMAEWNPEEGFERLKCEVSKIRSSRILGNEKPHFAITPPIFTHHEDSSGDLPKPTIKVENLRDALVVQQLVSNDASEHENSVVSDLESINYSWNSVNGKKEKKTPQKDTIAFLSSLSSIDTIKSASARLINPPYES
ncbi:5441_t:CDS:10 [Entrophospora sp. SA101]|nr:5441_t:CDS:10 [Entrophospora sp. SA101]